MYLKKIGNSFYFYCRVPKDLIELLNRKELKKSLKTADFRTAKTAAKTYALELERLGVYMRTGIMFPSLSFRQVHAPRAVVDLHYAAYNNMQIALP
jgi:hypothetical protein